VAIPSLALALHIGTTSMVGLPTFLVFWFAATLVWMWNRESRATILVFAAGFVLAAGVELSRSFSVAVLRPTQLFGTIFGSISLGGALLLSVWALLIPTKKKTWANRPQTVALLQSPFTANPLHLVSEEGTETLISSSGERFPVRDGIPAFLKPEDLTGDNGKYNRLYETIGGFYDDIQRVVGAFRGVDLDSYFENYMSLLDVKAGDSVLETCVGTCLNFKYLPHGTKLSGLDLSPEMLANGQNNLRRWQMEADLYLGNAESLPFADASFDVVYSCGGFNFFSDRAKALREMIRVVKPGGHMMIEDETEEYVKSTYEKGPITSGFYSNRKQAVTVPIDLVPPEMEDIHVEMLKDGKFYAITFRKPALV
ncbi:MAG TPA: methyltransferase domain-containing protein, partial [Terracidiphilus sp.]|nr:methyltransferase domain-containing protein [Terracidiphilus sp.]